MRKITSNDAKKVYGVSTCHQEMDNGEFRFRLLKNDGTSYIRTEASQLDMWQHSHYHNALKETYIIQKGLIAYAELVNGKRRIRVYKTGQMFTTQPGIVHNIYLTSKTIIHTIKHGEASTNDRIQDEITKQFDKDIMDLTLDQILDEAVKSDDDNSIIKVNEHFTEEYRHFDNLIWQLPAWCTAIFLVTAVGTNSIQQAVFLTETKHLSINQIGTGFLSLMFFVIFALSHVLYRFRQHQALLRQSRSTPIWSSAQTYLQLIVTIEALTLLFVVLIINGLYWIYTGLICIILLLLLTVYREFKICMELNNCKQIV